MIVTEDEARAFVAKRCEALAIERLTVLVEALAAENENQNLVARPTLDTVWTRHVADSAQLLDHCTDGEGLWLDLGSGAGFPGLVIAAMRPESSVTLVESRKRRVEWLGRAIELMGLENCRVDGRRLEQVETCRAAVISARAFAPLDRLLSLSARFSTSTTCWVLPKGRSAEQEVQGLPRDCRAMFHVEQSQTDPEAGIVVGRGQWSGHS